MQRVNGCADDVLFNAERSLLQNIALSSNDGYTTQKTRTAVGPRNAHFISVRQVSSDTGTLLHAVAAAVAAATVYIANLLIKN